MERKGAECCLLINSCQMVDSRRRIDAAKNPASWTCLSRAAPVQAFRTACLPNEMNAELDIRAALVKVASFSLAAGGFFERAMNSMVLEINNARI